MPAQRVEHHDWSTTPCCVVNLPDDPHKPFHEEPHLQRIADMRAWLCSTEAKGLYQLSVYLSEPGPDGNAGLHPVYRFTERDTAERFRTRFC